MTKPFDGKVPAYPQRKVDPNVGTVEHEQNNPKGDAKTQIIADRIAHSEEGKGNK